MVDTVSVAVSGPPPGHRVPGYAQWLLTLAPVVMLPVMFVATVVAAGLAPLGDPTPLFIALVSLLARRWDRVHTRYFDVCIALAAIALVEYALVYVSLRFGVLTDRQLSWIGGLFSLYVLQMIGTLVFFGITCLLSRACIVGLRKASDSPFDG